MKIILYLKLTLLALLILAASGISISQLRAQEGSEFPLESEFPPSEESLAEPSDGSTPQTFAKELVEVPPQEEKPTLDAGDFRDPFFFLKGRGSDARDALKPGTTLDGLKFNAYNKSQGFVDRYYKNSNFVLEDVYGRVEFVNTQGNCLNCHRGIEEISQNHQFSCIKCHDGNLKGKTAEQAHRGMVSNPSDLKHAGKYCGQCHKDQVEKVSNSLMTTARGVIEITREAWGEPPLPQPGGGKKKSRKSSKAPWQYVSPGKPVDDFLQKKCLRCHVQSASPHRPGDYRATGCASCHMVYTNEGTSLSRDRAIQKVQKADRAALKKRFSRDKAANSLNNRRGYPLLHKFTVAIPSIQCEHCHNYNGVGNEFEGLFGKPARPKMGQAAAEKNQSVLYGRSHDFLLPDIHREKGMHCIDCHGSDEVKADASTNPTQHDAVKVRCETCHGTNTTAPTGFILQEKSSRAEELLKKNQLNPNLMKKIKIGDTVMMDAGGNPMPHVLLVEGKWILYSKVTGKEHPIPLLKFLKNRPYAHQILGHMKDTECSACHARWSANEWGMHVIREEQLNEKRWRDWAPSDPTLQQLLSGSGTDIKQKPLGMLNWHTALNTPDGVKGSWSKGVWNTVFSEADWNSLILGKNERNKYTIMKPRYQYFISTPATGMSSASLRAQVPHTPAGRPGWVMTPHSPHTIRSTTRPCGSCHENALTTGLGDPLLQNIGDGEPFLKELKSTNRIQPQFQIRQMVSGNGWSLQNPLPKGKLRFMKSKEIRSLLKHSDRYSAYQFLDLRRNGHSRLLNRMEFPYDLKHKVNEEKFGEPGGEEALLYYDLDQHEFFETQRPEPSPEPEPSPDSVAAPARQEPVSQDIAESATPLEETPSALPEPPGSTPPAPLPPLSTQQSEPDFFIDLKSNEPAEALQPLPEKGILDHEIP